MSNHTTHNNQASLVGVIGNPIQHSKSPLMHNYFLNLLKINARYDRYLIEDPDDLPLFLRELRSPEWVGVNVTIPYKQSVVPYLDKMSNEVAVMGACNTIVNQKGRLIGYNTDVDGFLLPIKNIKLKSVLIFGNGGSSRAVIYACLKHGYSTVTVAARDPQKSADYLRRLSSLFGTKVSSVTIDAITPKELSSYDLVVNATNVGMNPDDDIFDCLSGIKRRQWYYDLIYSPWHTNMFNYAHSKGTSVLNGAWMLAGQGALAFEHFFNRPVEPMIMMEVLIRDQEAS